MGKRYVAKTYNNRRALRVFMGSVLVVVVAALLIFLVLFIVLEPYWVDGRLQIPWLMDELAD